MIDAPDTKHRAWKFLLREITGSNQFRKLSAMTQFELEMGLCLPIAIARWLAAKSPELLDLDELHIVVAGAEWGFDTADDGRWYQLLPFLLGRQNLKVKISLVGPNIYTNTDRPKKVMTNPSGSLKLDITGVVSNLAPATMFQCTLGEYIRKSQERVDAIILSHPGFESYFKDWLADDELKAALSGGAPIIALSYSREEFDHEIWILNTFGFAHSWVDDGNPFAIKDKEARISTAVGHTVWELSPIIKPVTITEENLALIARFSQWGTVLLEQGFSVENPSTGNVVMSEGIPSKRGIFVPLKWIVALESGQVIELQEDGSGNDTDFCLSAATLDKYDENHLTAFEKRLWAREAYDEIEQRGEELF